MGRGVVKIEKIKEEKRRQSTLRKRKKSLFKKAWEFSTLCGVDTLIILYDPVTNPDEPETWPENLNEVKRIINRYQEISSVNRRRSFHLPDFFTEKTKRIDQELQQLQKGATSDKYSVWDERFNSLSQDQLVIILSKLNNKLDVIRNRIDEKRSCELVNFNTQANSSETRGIGYQYLPAMTEGIINNMNFTAVEDVRPIDFQLPYHQMIPFNNYNQNLLQNTVMMQYSPALNRQVCFDSPWMQGNVMPDNVNPLMSYYAQTMQQTVIPPLQQTMIPPLQHSLMQMDRSSSQIINSYQDNYRGSIQNHKSQHRH